MKDLLLVTGDMVIFMPNFTPAIVIATGPAIIIGKSKVLIGGKPVCIEGDEKSVTAPCIYTIGAFTIPGTGILTISGLDTSQKVPGVKIGGQSVLVKGQQFTAKFTQTTPATNPAGPPPDTTVTLTGKGMFMPSQFQVVGG